MRDSHALAGCHVLHPSVTNGYSACRFNKPTLRDNDWYMTARWKKAYSNTCMQVQGWCELSASHKNVQTRCMNLMSHKPYSIHVRITALYTDSCDCAPWSCCMHGLARVVCANHHSKMDQFTVSKIFQVHMQIERVNCP